MCRIIKSVRIIDVFGIILLPVKLHSATSVLHCIVWEMLLWLMCTWDTHHSYEIGFFSRYVIKCDDRKELIEKWISHHKRRWYWCASVSDYKTSDYQGSTIIFITRFSPFCYCKYYVSVILDWTIDLNFVVVCIHKLSASSCSAQFTVFNILIEYNLLRAHTDRQSYCRYLLWENISHLGNFAYNFHNIKSNIKKLRPIGILVRKVH